MNIGVQNWGTYIEDEANIPAIDTSDSQNSTIKE